MNRGWAGLVLALTLSGCTLLPRPSPEAFTFAVMGDTPYSDTEELIYESMLKRLDEASLAFVVHVGDFKTGSTPCSDAVFAKRLAEFDASAHPFLFTPGDNEWTDCRRTKGDPVERLARIREMFFSTATSLGRTRIPTEVQTERHGDCPAYVENRAWSRAGVRFVTLNFPGGHNNMGIDAAGDAEARCRNEANRRWLERAVLLGESPQVRALVVAIQANPWISRRGGYKPFLAQLQASARRLRKPVLFIHGDTHTYRVDTPFVDSSGAPDLAITRLETYGSPFVGWVRVTVDPSRPQPFTFEPMLVGIGPPPR